MKVNTIELQCGTIKVSGEEIPADRLCEIASLYWYKVDIKKCKDSDLVYLHAHRPAKATPHPHDLYSVKMQKEDAYKIIEEKVFYKKW